VWTAPPLTSGLFLLAAFFEAAALLTLVQAAVLAVLLFANIFLMSARLLVLSRVTSRGFLNVALAAWLTRSGSSAALFHSLIAIAIVCHISYSPYLF
jgi:hypothetical protein